MGGIGGSVSLSIVIGIGNDIVSPFILFYGTWFGYCYTFGLAIGYWYGFGPLTRLGRSQS